MADEIDFENGRISNFLRDLDFDLGSGHMAYRRASLIGLYLHTKFHSNRRNFLWTNVRRTYVTDGRTDQRSFRKVATMGTLAFGRTA